MDSKIFKTLSPAQQSVVNCLMVHDSYVHISPYYNHNKVVSNTALQGDGFEYWCLMQFTRTTLNVLLNKHILVNNGDHKDKFILNPDI